MSVESVMLSNRLILCCPLLLLLSIFPSIRVFSKELALHIRWPKYWSFIFSISPPSEYSGLIFFFFFRSDWFDLLAGQGTLKSLLRHHNWKASVLRHSAFFRASLVAQTVKNPPAMQETWVWSLGWEDSLEEDMATHSSILAWRSPMNRGTWWTMVHGIAKSRTRLSD